MVTHLRQFLLPVLFLMNVCGIFAQDASDLRMDLTHSSGKEIYFKIDQGFSLNRLLDQKMSNLHYTGPGGILNFGRRVHREKYTAEWHFARLQFHYTKPAHQSTLVYNPAYGIRYMHLRKIVRDDSWLIQAGGQADIFANVRIAPRLGNSFLFADVIGEVSPRADVSASYYFLWKEWQLDFSLSASLLGMAVRMPEYGVSFQLSEDGGVKVQGYEAQMLHPLNYGHLVSGLFIRESFGRSANPNWFRIGYIWDYYTLGGRYKLNVNHATHQFVLELYFKVN